MSQFTMPLFVELVAKMRQAQKDYFETRHQIFLTEAKLLEGKVDQFISDWKGGLTQSDLFNEEVNNG